MRIRRTGLLAAGLAAALVLAACGDSGFSYVKNSSEGSFLRVPDSWELYDGDEYFALTQAGTLAEQLDLGDPGWAVAFDAAPEPSLLNVVSYAATYPTGVTRVRPVTFAEHDQASFASLRNLDLPVDDLVDTGDAILLLREELESGDGHWGTRVAIAVRNRDGELMVIDQTAYFDVGATRVYSLTMSCDLGCYYDNLDTIDDVVDSWTLEER